MATLREESTTTLGKGSGGIDAMTLYPNTQGLMPRVQWKYIELVCFTGPDMDGNYFTDVEHSARPTGWHRVSRVRFEELGKAFGEAREQIRKRIKRITPKPD
jgi:hypothetical protein